MLITPSKSDQSRAAAILELRRRRNQIGDSYSKYIDNPVGFIESELGCELTDPQKDIVNSVWDNRTTNVQAAHGQGKTYIAAMIALAWLYVKRGLVITTAPTSRQVKLLLWAEIRKAWPRGKFGGRGPDTMQLIVSNDVAAYGYTAEDTDENAFQGVHHPKLLAIQDEASGISPAIDEGFQSCCSGVDNRMLRIGNPTDPTSAFKRSCEADGAILIPAWTHPNTSWAYNGDQLKPLVESAITKRGTLRPRSEWPDWAQAVDPIKGAISIEWIEDARTKYGESSKFWKSRVCGEWPEDSDDSLLPYSWFVAAIERYKDNTEYWDSRAREYMTRHGLDIGDGGDDHSSATWRGPVLCDCLAYKTKGDMLDISRAESIGYELAKDGGVIVVDNTGVGAGALSGLVKKQDIHAMGMRFGERAEDHEKYANKKTEGFWLLREQFRTEVVAVKPFEGWEQVARELSSIGYIFDGDKIRIEKKKETKKKLGKSPDLADSTMMAFMAPSTRAEQSSSPTSGGGYAGMSII